MRFWTPRRGARRARAQDGPESMRRQEAQADARKGARRARARMARVPANPPPLCRQTSERLFDLGGLLQAFDIVLEFLLHDGVAELRLHLVEGRVARILELDDVPAVLGLYGVGRHFTFLQ